MEKDFQLKIIYLDSIDSTQSYIKELLKKNRYELPFAVIANTQSKGIGSRNNSWDGLSGNLFLSFGIKLKELPVDLKLESSSIYFAYLLKDLLKENGSKVWLKWPNDFYINNLKIGGMITNIIDDVLVCGVGLNLVNSPKEFTKLDIEISKIDLLNKYFKKIEKRELWKQVFSKYKLEFHRNKEFFTHINDVKVSLGNAILENDGSIVINGKRIYSLR